jgi:hypothetical protein
VSKLLPWISLGLAGLALAIIVGIVVSNQAATSAGTASSTSAAVDGSQGDCYYPNPEAHFEATLDGCQQEFGTVEWCPSGQPQGSQGCVAISYDPGLCYFGSQNAGRAPERFDYEDCSSQEGAASWCPPGAASDAVCVDIE